MTDPLLRGGEAPDPRTLVDILRATIEAHPDAPAIDNGTSVLTYGEFADAAEEVSDALRAAGVERGDRVGIRIPSGTLDLYVAIAGILYTGAAYVPVDFDDPDERARVVFGEADVAAVITTDLVVRAVGEHPAYESSDDAPPREDPTTEDDAWIIFTSGSTGTPKGVAVTNRNAAAFVDAESRMFLQDRSLGPGDRVMAGLSVAFDASCEEMWLAWRYGACLVPAPRSLVRSGVELGPWLTANGITVVSTVPTLVALWPTEALAAVRLLILGGEACPPEIGARLANENREVWNTYGPTEATVVACGAQLDGTPPVRIGLPLAGWDLAVVDEAGNPVPEGESGQLIIGGVGLARYLDEAKDKAAYAAMPTLGWDRAYRSGDMVRRDSAGLVFLGRIDDQVKVGGRRIELGEIDSALLSLPGVSGAAAAVRRSEAGNTLLVGYVTVEDGFDTKASAESLRQSMPAALVPRLAVVDTLPTRTSGKIDRDALPWPLPSATSAPGAGAGADASDTAGWVSGLWASILGGPPGDPDEDFFDVGGGSLSAAQLVSRLRERFPEVTVADIYENSSLATLSAALDEMETPTGRLNRDVPPVPGKTQAAQILATVALRSIAGLRWLTWIGLGNAVARNLFDLTWLPTVHWWWLALGWLLLIFPIGRMALSALGARILLRGLTPGEYPRGGAVHLRIWLAERLVDELGATNLSGAPFIKVYARWLGARIAKDVDLHTVPPVTGMLDLGPGASIEPEVDLRGHWIDGAKLLVGPVRVRAGARVGARSTLLPGADIGKRAEVAPGSAVFGAVPDEESWSGAPAEPSGAARGPWHDAVAPNRPVWQIAYAVSAVLVALLPVAATLIGATVVLSPLSATTSIGDALRTALLWIPVAVTAGFVALALLVLVLVRLLSIGLHAGAHPVHGRQAWQAWTTLRILDDARTWLFPLYSSSLTPAWLRGLGADLGPDVEASTVLLIPKFARVGEGAFLADDTLVAGYELGSGWLRVENVRIGKHAFVGNSGMAAPGRKVPKKGLVAVLSAAPRRKKAKAGTSWLGSPPRPLRREGTETDSGRTYAPATKLRVARAFVEALRAIPVWLHIALVVLVVAAIEWLLAQGLFWAVLASGLVLLAAGAVAAGLATAAKWLLIGKLRPGNHPLWSSFVWRNELADTFVEVIAAPWFARAATGTLVLNEWLRSMGAKIGDGVWLETYWLPEADLVRLDDGASINAGTVVQTHLFHDRVLSMDTVTVKRGGTLGPNSVILPAAQIGRHATVGPVSLVMRGESVPDRTRWIGNPVGPWVDDE
ncbi:Pls/PosA family non-ribosomal peptide synthetase [Knoellia subterranea]|uniref:Amino acid adenylation protein n=1 Tax=Knoellia subterranea KCTC 19937 TaxID=1385521 RepID=A0A0A0JRM2_9MICO|nr:Pls/PosA family non-ribosomal peptide synthetase [Knoellia subterranea]KGN38251.1 amino acid adenylation protein [Knoellia subterranea KCTC 19937]